MTFQIDIPLSAWFYKHERSWWVDGTFGFSSQTHNAIMNRKQPSVDVTLFLRPFTRSSWIMIGVAIVLVSLTIYLPGAIMGPHINR